MHNIQHIATIYYKTDQSDQPHIYSRYISKTSIVYICIHVFNVNHSIIDLCFKYIGVQIFAIYFYIPILCKMHFHVTLRCVNDLPNYVQGLFHLKNNSLSNRKTEH